MIWIMAMLFLGTVTTTDEGGGRFTIRADNSTPSNADAAWCRAYELAGEQSWGGIKLNASGEGANVFELDVEEGDNTNEEDYTLAEIAETWSCDEDADDEG